VILPTVMPVPVAPDPLIAPILMPVLAVVPLKALTASPVPVAPVGATVSMAVALLLVMETRSFDVAGDNVVPDLDQKPDVPEELPVILPLQVKLPVALATVQPVAPDPPAILTSTAPSACKFKAVALALMVAEVPSVKVVVEVADREAAVVRVASELAVNVVAFDRLSVAFAIVAVPELAPMFNVVAAPKALTVVAVVLKRVREL